MEKNGQPYKKLIFEFISFFIVLGIGFFIFQEFVTPRMTSTTNSVVREEITPKEYSTYQRFVENPSFVSYLTEVIGNYQVIDHGDEYVILKVINSGYLGTSINYYYYNDKYFELINIKNDYGRIVSTTSDNLNFESVLDASTRNKYEIDSHMVKYYFGKGADISDVFTHIKQTDKAVSISNFLKNLKSTKKVEKEISDSISDDFINQLK